VLAGHENQRRELQPTAGESQTLAIQLQRLPEPAAPAPPASPPPSTVVSKPPEPAPKLPTAPSGPLPTITNSIGMQLALIPAGQVLMGSSSKVLDYDASDNEMPQHRVRITRPFYLGIYEVTQGQFRRFVEETGYTDGPKEWQEQFRTQNDDHPGTYVNWQDAAEFCKWLSAKEGQTYRLPTEAEWEYAYRAGTQTRFSFGDADEVLSEYAWFSANAGNTTHPVGQKKPNAWGLFDMQGNVCEWCADWYDAKYYESSPQDNPAGPAVGSKRVFRGGSWNSDASSCRAAYRIRIEPSYRNRGLGFRLARQFPASSP